MVYQRMGGCSIYSFINNDISEIGYFEHENDVTSLTAFPSLKNILKTNQRHGGWLHEEFYELRDNYYQTLCDYEYTIFEGDVAEYHVNGILVDEAEYLAFTQEFNLLDSVKIDHGILLTYENMPALILNLNS
jgi:hypothetical protein